MDPMLLINAAITAICGAGFGYYAGRAKIWEQRAITMKDANVEIATKYNSLVEMWENLQPERKQQHTAIALVFNILSDALPLQAGWNDRERAEINDNLQKARNLLLETINHSTYRE